MKREFLRGLGLEDAVVDKIMAENGSDINRARADAAEAQSRLAELQEQLTQAQKELAGLKETADGAETMKAELEKLRTQYDTDTEGLKKQIADRDYADAVTQAIAGAKVRFSSRGAEKAFRAALTDKALTLTDGKLEGFEDFLKQARSEDPDAFASDRPTPKISGATGPGGAPDAEPANVRFARQLAQRRAATAQAATDAFGAYTPGVQQK